MDATQLHTILLHERWDLAEECGNLLCHEWKCSLTASSNTDFVARLHQLGKSSDEFPVSLVMIPGSDSKRNGRVVGHSRISLIPRQAGCLWISSVVIDQSLRGMGLGRHLMLATENYAKKRGYMTLLLSTHGDTKNFYEKLGYDFCSPLPTSALIGWDGSEVMESQPEHIQSRDNTSTENCEPANAEPEPERRIGVAPPPPPPPPQFTSNPVTPKLFYLKKDIS